MALWRFLFYLKNFEHTEPGCGLINCDDFK
jgi:hypothetical protein